MSKLEELQINASVRGILPNSLVSVVSVQWFGSEALELSYKDTPGKVANELLYRHNEPRIEVVAHGQPWSFDGDGHQSARLRGASHPSSAPLRPCACGAYVGRRAAASSDHTLTQTDTDWVAPPVDAALKWNPVTPAKHTLNGGRDLRILLRMRILVLRRLLIVLTGVAFLVGAAVQAMPRAEFMAPACMGAAQTATGDCCANMAMKDHAAPAPMKQVPCKGISLDCAKEFGCISSLALPARSTTLGTPTVYERVAYWPLATSRAGLSIKPGLFPPITSRLTA